MRDERLSEDEFIRSLGFDPLGPMFEVASRPRREARDYGTGTPRALAHDPTKWDRAAKKRQQRLSRRRNRR